MELIHYKEHRLIRRGEFKDVWCVKPKHKHDIPIWLHCINRRHVMIPHRTYVANNIGELLMMHGVSFISIDKVE